MQGLMLKAAYAGWLLGVVLLKSDSAPAINGCNLMDSISSRAVQLKPWLKGLWLNNFLITSV